MVIVLAERASAGRTMSVWVLTHDVSAGAPYSAGDVQQERLAASDLGFNYEVRGPTGYQARYVRDLQAQDILRVDDLTAAAESVEVSLTLQDPPPLSAGDTIDVFASLAGGRQARIGRALPVLAVTGSSVDVVVPASDEGAWVAVGSSSTSLHAVRTTAGLRTAPPPLTVDDAIGQLCGAACDATPAHASPGP
jgi:hypothetical protein